MKKIIAALLAVLCVVSLLSVGLCAAAKDEVGYGIIYENGGVPMMYEPAPTFRFSGPGYAKVSADTPISVDYEFKYWEDENGNHYDPGQEIPVYGIVRLHPHMEKKNDGDIHTTRVIKTALQALIRVLGKAINFFNTMEDEFRPA